MIRYCDNEGIVEVHGLHYKNNQKENIILPSVAIGVFSRFLVKDLVKKFKGKKVGYISCANYESDVYIINYKNQDITLFMAHVGAPRIADDIEELRVHGVKMFIIYGNCGVLDKTIKDCSIIIPTKGYREEGVSYHYIKPSNTIKMNEKYKKDFINILKQKKINYTLGYTWTTDAPYRETKDKVEYFRSKGCVSVEMEGTAIAAVCKRLNLDYFTFYYAGDNLDSIEWEARSIHGLSKLNIKKEVSLLALDLAIQIIEKENKNEF